MAIVVETVSAVATATSSNLTITKPTGVAVGELLVAVLFAANADLASIAGDNWAILAGWTEAQGGFIDAGSNGAYSIQYKVATSAEVAASNFTFSFGDSETLRGYIVRASGNIAVGEPLGAIATSYTPVPDGALVFTQFFTYSITSPIPGVISGYTAPGVTFVEGDQSTYGDGTPGARQASAYGIQTTAEEIDSFSATGGGNGKITIFLPPVNASGSNTLATTTATAFAQAGTCDTIGGTNILAEATGVTLAQTGKETSPAQWTNEAKPSTTWVNETK